MPARQTNSSDRRSPTCCSDRSPTCSTATCPTRRRTARCAACCRCWRVNTTYRGPATPGTAAALAYGFAVPDENALLVKKLRGGIGALTSHLLRGVHLQRRRTAAAQQGRRDPGRPTAASPGSASRTARRSRAPIVISGVAPDLTVNGLRRPERGARRHPGAVLPRRPSRQLPADALRARRHTGIRGALRGAQRSRNAVQHRHLQHSRRAAAAVGGLQARHRARRPVDRAADPVGQRPRPGAAGQARGVGVLAVVSGRGHASPATAR